MKILAIILVFGLVNKGFSQDVTNRQILEKLEKMDTKINNLDVRITRLEEGQKSLQKQVDILSSEIKDVRAEIKDVRAEIKDVRAEINDVVSDIKGFMLWGFGILFLGMFSLVGFVLWDRRSALAPTLREMKALEEREGRIETILKEFAKIEPKFAEAFKYAGFL